MSTPRQSRSMSELAANPAYRTIDGVSVRFIEIVRAQRECKLHERSSMLRCDRFSAINPMSRPAATGRQRRYGN